MSREVVEVDPRELLEQLRSTVTCDGCGKCKEFINGKWVHEDTGDSICMDEDCKAFEREWVAAHRVQ